MTILKNPRTLALGGFLVGIAAAVVYASPWNWWGGEQVTAETVTVVRGDVVRELAVTGVVEIARDIDLAFARGGVVRRVTVAAGDEVAAGELLVELDRAELDADLAETSTKLASAGENLEKLRRGPAADEVTTKRLSLETATNNLTSAYANVAADVRGAYVAADDAVRTKTNALFTDDESDVPSLTFPVRDSQVQTDAVRGRVSSRLALQAWQTALAGMSATSTTSTLARAITDARDHLGTVSAFLDKLFNSVSLSVGLTASTTATYQKSVTLARDNVAGALGDIDERAQKITTQEASVARAAGELALKLSGPATADVAAQEAKVAELTERAARIRTQLSQLTLRSPVAGVVSDQRAGIGDVVASKKTVVTIIPRGALQVAAAIPESDVAAVAIGDAVRVTFGALAGEPAATGTVTAINPVGMVADGATTFAATVAIASPDARVKAGMTARVAFADNVRRNVIVVPAWALADRGDGTWEASVQASDGIRPTRVTVGLRGTDGTVEVLSGLASGDVVARIAAQK